MYVEGPSVTMDGARMKRMLSVGSSLSVINIHEHLSLAQFFPKYLCSYCCISGLLDTGVGVPPQTQDLETLLEETLVWTMSNVR